MPEIAVYAPGPYRRRVQRSTRRTAVDQSGWQATSLAMAPLCSSRRRARGKPPAPRQHIGHYCGGYYCIAPVPCSLILARSRIPESVPAPEGSRALGRVRDNPQRLVARYGRFKHHDRLLIGRAERAPEGLPFLNPDLKRRESLICWIQEAAPASCWPATGRLLPGCVQIQPIPRARGAC